MFYVPFLPPDWFSTQSLQYQNLNANTYSVLTVNELGPPVLESSARDSKFYTLTDSEPKFNETEIENWLAIGYNLGSPLLGTRTHNRYICSSANGKRLQVLYTTPIHKVLQ